MDTCAQIYCVKYHVKQFNNKRVILKKCVVLTGGLEVSFSIVSSIIFRKGFAKFMVLISLFKKFLSEKFIASVEVSNMALAKRMS